MKSSMKRWRDGIIILLMAFSLLACQGDVAEARHYPDKIHLPVDYGDMVFTGFDETVLQDVLEEIQELYDSGALQKKDVQTRLRVEELYESMKAELNNLTTQVSLLGIQYDANGAEEELAETSAELASRGSALYDQCYQALALLVDTPYQNIIEADAGEINIERLRNYEALSDRMFELHDEEERLVQSYDRVMAQPQVTVDGEVWTEERLSSADLSNSEYRNISEQLEQAQNQEAGEIYRELIRVRTEIAEEAGYDNYIDYAYEVVYNRDYSLEDIQQVWKSVKKTIVPMEDYLMEGISSREDRKSVV